MKHLLKGIDISCIAACVPDNILNLKSLENIYPGELEKITKITGIESVRIAPKGVTAADLCEKAGRVLIQNENIAPSDIDALIFVSQTPDHILPQTSFLLQHKLGLSANTYCLDIHIGCSGYIYGILQASLLISSGIAKNVLLLAGDTTSVLVNEKDRANRMVFGDAGSATLIKKGTDDMHFSLHSDGSGAQQLIIPAGGYRKPVDDATSITTEREEGNWRSENDLYMDGMGVFNFAITKVPPLVNELIERAEWDKADVKTFVFHQANKFMIDYIRKRLKLQEEQVPIRINGYGNTGPSSIPLLLSVCGNELKEKKRLDKVTVAGFGVGLSWGGFTCNLNATDFIEPIIY